MVEAIRRFVTNLFIRYGHANDWPEVKRQYHEHLSKMDLSEDQWTGLLSELVSDEKELPALAVIDDYIRRRKAAQTSVGCTGWLMFTLYGRRKAVRIEKKDGTWLYATVEVKTQSGPKTLQKHPGELAQIPKGAINVVHVVDNATVMDPSEMPNKAEIAEIFASNWTGSKLNLDKYLKILNGTDPINELSKSIL